MSGRCEIAIQDFHSVGRSCVEDLPIWLDPWLAGGPTKTAIFGVMYKINFLWEDLHFDHPFNDCKLSIARFCKLLISNLSTWTIDQVAPVGGSAGGRHFCFERKIWEGQNWASKWKLKLWFDNPVVYVGGEVRKCNLDLNSLERMGTVDISCGSSMGCEEISWRSQWQSPLNAYDNWVFWQILLWHMPSF